MKDRKPYLVVPPGYLAREARAMFGDIVEVVEQEMLPQTLQDTPANQDPLTVERWDLPTSGAA